MRGEARSSPTDLRSAAGRTRSPSASTARRRSATGDDSAAARARAARRRRRAAAQGDCSRTSPSSRWPRRHAEATGASTRRTSPSASGSAAGRGSSTATSRSCCCRPPATSTINNVKLRPGYKPQLSWNSHWDIANQGASPTARTSRRRHDVTGGGKTLTATWTAPAGQGPLRHADDADRRLRRDARHLHLRRRQRAGGAGRRAVPLPLRLRLRAPHAARSVPLAVPGRAARGRRARTTGPSTRSIPGRRTTWRRNGGLRVWYGRHGETMPSRRPSSTTSTGRRQAAS